MNQPQHELFNQAIELISKEGYCSCELLMTHFKIGYNSSGRLVDELENRGVISPFEGSKRRRFLHNDWAASFDEMLKSKCDELDFILGLKNGTIWAAVTEERNKYQSNNT